MKLKTKRLLAAALALSLTANISLAAFAIDYNIDIDSVYVDGNTSWQGDEDTAEEDKHTLEENEDVYIYSESGESTDNTVTISGDVDNSVIIDNITFEVDDEDSAAITIENGSDVEDLTIQDTEITVNGTGSAGIEVGDEAEADITLSGDNDITLDADKTSGIKIGDNSEVTLTVDGDTTIKVDDDLLANLAEQETVYKTEDGVVTVAGATVRPNIEGITIGGEVASDSGEGSKISSNVTITTEKEDSSLTIEGATVGIHIYDQSELTIDGNGVDNKLVNEGDTDDDIDEKALEVNILETQGTNTDVSGHGILNYGKLTITDNTQLTIDSVTQNENYEQSANLEGIGSKGSEGVEISGGADVTISDVSAEKSGTLGNGISMSNSGGVEGYDKESDKLTIKGSGTTVKITGTSDDGIYLEGGEDLEVSGGATLEIGTYGDSDIGRNGIFVNEYIVPKMDDDGNVVKDDDGNIVYTVEGSGSVTISGDGTAVYINNAKYAGINFANADNDYKEKGDYGAKYNHIFIVDGGALLEVSGDVYGIYARNTNVTIGDDESETKVTVSGADKGIALIGTNETEFDVNNATLEILAFTSYGIVIGTEGNTYTNNNVVNIRNNAKVNIASERGGSIILWGGNNVMTIDNATLIANSGITLNGSSSSENADKKARTSTIYINNGARVEAASIFDYAGYRQVYKTGNTTAIPDGMGKLYVTGGTLKLTTVTTDENGELCIDLNSLGYEDATTLYKGTPWLWPTSGKENGDEPLTNFKLSVSELETLQAELWAEDKDLSAEEFFDKYGFLIEYEDGVPTTLTFQTYGVVDGEYYNYNEKKNNGTESNWYVVDLTKGYGDELWVWTPAVVLSYFELSEGNKLSDAVSSDESNPDGVTVGKDLTDYHDVVVRGQSIAFGNFQTNSDYTTTDKLEGTAYDIAKVAADKKGITLYIYDAMDEGENAVPADSLGDDDVIIVKGEDGKFYIANTDGSASETVAGTYYYALVDEDGNFILDDDGNFIWYDEDGVAYTAESENVALIAVLDSGTSYVLLASDGNYYRVNSNGEYTTVVAGEAIPVDSLWSVFDEYTRVRSNAQASDATYNFENVFGGVATTATEVEPQEPEESEEPEEPDETEEPDEPVIPIVPVVPVTPDTPAQPETPAETPAETPEETPAETPADPEAPAEPATPASSTPKTGDDSNVAIYLVMAALSGAALIGLGVTGKKKNEEV